MEPHGNNKMPQNKPMNLPSPWSTSTRLNSAGSYFHDPFAFGGQPICVTNTESEEAYEITSPFTKHSWEGEPWSANGGNTGSSSTIVGYEGLPSIMKQQSNMMFGNGLENTYVASHHLGVDPTELDKNLGQDAYASSINPQPEMQVSDKKGKQKKRKSHRELAKKPKIQEQQEYEEQSNKVDKLRAQNNMLKEKLERLSEECLDLSNENIGLENQKELVEKYGAEISEILESFDSSLPEFFGGGGDDDES